MTKPTMPEPVACLWIKSGVVVNAFNRPPRLLDGDPWSEYFIKKGFTEEPIITTTKAEAYKDACVREALEEAIDKVALHGGSVEIEAAIRALLPSTPARPESEQ